MIDLHTHTNNSDGNISVTNLLKEAEKLKLDYISITDHNNIDAYKELQSKKIRNLFSGKIIPGIEITTSFNGEIIEVLGYNFDIAVMSKLLKEKVLTFKQLREKEYELIKNQYRKIGVKFKEENIKFDPCISSCRRYFLNEIIKYTENNKFFLFEKSKGSNIFFTRDEVYNPKSKLYVDETKLFLSLEETIKLIHDANGLAFFAHAFIYSEDTIKNIEKIITEYNFDGIECFHTTFTNENSKYLIRLCNKYDLYKSGGSDYHGSKRKDYILGTVNKNQHIEKDIIKDWQ